ncbi:MAG: glycosyltransferase family 39 protein [Candidatus Dadabacteria bacterium]|nr:glycosyltransferase family 39 protein [Candidatus Dadabacteria bacterium]
MVSQNDALVVIKGVLRSGHEGNPPFYYVLLHFWVLLFGDSEFSLRFLSATLGSVSIFAIYALGKLLFNKRIGIIAALIIAVSVFHIQFSQEARGYTLSVLLTIISFYSLIKLTARMSISSTVIYLVSSILMIYTHYYGLFVLVAQNIFCLTLFLKHRKTGKISIKQWTILQLIVILAFIPGLLHLLILRASMQKSFWITEPTLERLGDYLVVYSGSVYLLVLFAVFALISVIGLRKITSVARLKMIFRTRENDNLELGISSGYKVYLLVLWFTFPILLPMIISIVSTPMFVSRYAISATLAFYLLASKGIDSLKNRWAILIIGVIILILSVVNLQGYYENVYKHQWREVMSEIENSAGSGDVIVIYPHHEQLSARYYKTRDDIKIMPMKDKFPTVKNLGGRRVWVVMHAHPLNRKHIREGLSSTYNFELERHFIRLDLFKFRQK